MYIFDGGNSYEKQLHQIHLKAQRNPATSVTFEIDRLADDDDDLAGELMQEYCDRYGYPSEVVAKNGYVYFMQAEGFYGIFSWLVGRYKIGKSNNPKRRHTELNGQQAPCPVRIVRYIQIDDMSAVETKLHKQYAKSRKHGEWFDFWFWQVPLVHFSYDRFARDFRANKMATFPSPKAIASTGVALVLLGLTAALFVSSLMPQTEASNQQIRQEKRIK